MINLSIYQDMNMKYSKWKYSNFDLTYLAILANVTRHFVCQRIEPRAWKLVALYGKSDPLVGQFPTSALYLAGRREGWETYCIRDCITPHRCTECQLAIIGTNGKSMISCYQPCWLIVHILHIVWGCGFELCREIFQNNY